VRVLFFKAGAGISTNQRSLIVHHSDRRTCIGRIPFIITNFKSLQVRPEFSFSFQVVLVKILSDPVEKRQGYGFIFIHVIIEYAVLVGIDDGCQHKLNPVFKIGDIGNIGKKPV